MTMTSDLIEQRLPLTKLNYGIFNGIWAGFFVYCAVQLLYAAGKILINDLEFELNDFVQIHGVFDWIYDLKAQRVGLDATNLWFDIFSAWVWVDLMTFTMEKAMAASNC